jgi:hypothetical protein
LSKLIPDPELVPDPEVVPEWDPGPLFPLSDLRIRILPELIPDPELVPDPKPVLDPEPVPDPELVSNPVPGPNLFLLKHVLINVKHIYILIFKKIKKNLLNSYTVKK